METFRFLRFQVYTDSKVFFATCITITQSFPRPFWELGEQLRRAALSVSLNIAEGSAKYSDKDFHRFLEIAQGSITESLACCDIAKDHKLIQENQFNHLFELGMSIAKQIGGLSKKVRETKK
ncbi:four helix bundle protein [Patescibacteria group bacterium]|nr:four helix bundle protein [Patescibacteria group bacterium]